MLDSKILLGIIAVTIFGSFAVSGLFVQAGLEDLEIITVQDPNIHTGVSIESEAICPATHKVIGGGIFLLSNSGGGTIVLLEKINLARNLYVVTAASGGQQLELNAFATCAKINFPLNLGSMIGGELLDINTASLLIGAIGVNPVITGLIGITLVGVVGQAVWFVHRRRKSENS